MERISLDILDEYAKRLTNSQAKKLYESKNGKHYQKALYEQSNTHTIYLNEYTLLKKAHKKCNEFTYMLNEKYGDLMDNIYYKIEEDALIMKTDNDKLYEQLVDILKHNGIRNL
ncbi:MAG: hypothetical protein [Wendovervirus sonii]|uniref:Uncharacterized protein n=1 Tax=phage Lak_Megaphage_Sonny TaxID=3109229 RepID=A0ABZ0Z3L6_9CAUD|nr:MAG: hypothetical protein [phage Lak_Megaphage_Sonny]